MDILGDELLNIWKAFNHHGLKYIMVGGFATNLHGFFRTTGDADILIEDTVSNRKALRKSLAALDFGDFEAFETIDFIPEWSALRLPSGMELDLMTYLKGFDQSNFSTCYKMASIAQIQGIEVPFLHINHLIAEKKATNRPKDQIDINALEEIRKRRKDL